MVPALLFALIFFGLWLVIRNFGPPLVRVSRDSGRFVSEQLATRFDLFPSARVIRREGRWRRWIPVALVLAGGLAVSFLGVNLFVEIAETLEEQTSAVDRFDRIIHQQTPLWATANTTLFFTGATVLGDPPFLIALTALLCGALWWKGERIWALYLAFTSLGGGLLNLALKSYFQRARPDISDALRAATGYSFPSGHSMGSVVIYGAILWVLVRILPSWRRHSVSSAALITLVLAIGLSRIYLKVHWFSDVIAGFAAGIGWVATSTACFEAWLQVRRGGRVSELLRTTDPAGE